MAKPKNTESSSGKAAAAKIVHEAFQEIVEPATVQAPPVKSPKSATRVKANGKATPNGKQRPPAKFVPPVDAKDIEGLYDDPLGDALTDDEELLDVPLGRPRGFIRVHPDPAYRKRAYMYVHKEDDDDRGEIFIVHRGMVKHMPDEAQPCILVTYVNRAGNPGIWPIKVARADQNEVKAWTSAARAAKRLIQVWGKLQWSGRAYKVRPAAEGYAGEPIIDKLPSFDQLLTLACGAEKIIRDTDHPVYRDSAGLPVEGLEVADDLAGDEDDDAVA